LSYVTIDGEGWAMRSTRTRAVGAVVALGIVGGWFLGSGSAAASGGGGCGRPVTDAGGVTISIRSFCFTPTILRIRPGQTVTWTNRDGFPHTVIGANAVWGSFAALGHHEQVTYRFPRAGVYPYVCTFHPGMVGAVVVGAGNGVGAAPTTTLATGPILVPPSVAPAVVAAPRPIRRVSEPSTGLRGSVVMVGLLSILAASAIALVIRRRRAPVA
jgi:plastocyanin